MKGNRQPVSPASSGPLLLSDVNHVNWSLIAAGVMVAGVVVTFAISGCVFTHRRSKRKLHLDRRRNQGVLCSGVRRWKDIWGC